MRGGYVLQKTPKVNSTIRESICRRSGLTVVFSMLTVAGRQGRDSNDKKDFRFERHIKLKSLICQKELQALCSDPQSSSNEPSKLRDFVQLLLDSPCSTRQGHF